MCIGHCRVTLQHAEKHCCSTPLSQYNWKAECDVATCKTPLLLNPGNSHLKTTEELSVVLQFAGHGWAPMRWTPRTYQACLTPARRTLLHLPFRRWPHLARSRYATVPTHQQLLLLALMGLSMMPADGLFFNSLLWPSATVVSMWNHTSDMTVQ